MSTQSVMPSISPRRPLLLPPSIFPSIRVFSIESALRIRWPKYWSFSFASVLPMNIQGWFPSGLTSLISLNSQGLSRALSSTTIWNISSWVLSLLYDPTLTSVHDYWKNQSFDYTHYSHSEKQNFRHKIYVKLQHFSLLKVLSGQGNPSYCRLPSTGNSSSHRQHNRFIFLQKHQSLFKTWDCVLLISFPEPELSRESFFLMLTEGFFSPLQWWI